MESITFEGFLADVATFEYGNNVQIILLGEVVVSLIVSGNGHDSPCAIGAEDIVRDIDWYYLVVDGVNGIGSGEDTCFVLIEFGSFEVGLVAC